MANQEMIQTSKKKCYNSRYQLTFHKPTKRWKKWIAFPNGEGGKVFYFLGDSSGYKTDASYKIAYEQYKQQFARLYGAAAIQAIEAPAEPTIQAAPAALAPAPIVAPIIAPPPAPTAPAIPSLKSFAERWIADLLIRYQAHEVSSSYYYQTSEMTDDFISVLGKRTPANSVNEESLDNYRRHTMSLVARKKISPYTAKHRFANARAFVRQLWKARHIDMPRNLDDFGKVKLPPLNPKTFSVAEIKLLWETAQTNQQKLIIALGLNLCCGQQDISDLAPSELQGGFIVRNRSKTGVPCRYKLWDVSKQLIELCKSKSKRKLFLTAKGNNLVDKTLRDGKRFCNDSVKLTFARVCKRAKLKGKTFYHLRKTAVTELARLGYPAEIQEAFLAHTNHDSKDMRRHYVSKEVEQQRIFSQLEKGIMELDTVFNLKLKTVVNG